MIELVLNNIVSLYYPFGICASQDYDEYVETLEHKTFIKHLNNNFDLVEELSIDVKILDKLKENVLLKDIKNITSRSFDKCLSYKIEFIEDDFLYQLCLNISLITPYYCIYVLKNRIKLNPYKWVDTPTRDFESEKHKFNNQMNLIKNIIESNYNFSHFPEFLINKIIPNVNYSDIEIGEFTYFNAFFLDDIKL